jgi:hypothetical protein
VSATTLFLVAWFLVICALFGLARLLIARRGTDEDWQLLVAFGKRMPLTLEGPLARPAAWADALALAPPGLLPEGDATALTSQTVHERLRAHQAMLQAEMKWFAHRLPNPFLWFLAGVRGIALAPFGLSIELDARARARRRELEQHADFQRVVTGVLAVVLFVVLAATLVSARAGLEWLREGMR